MGELHLPRLRGAVGFIADTSWREHGIEVFHDFPGQLVGQNALDIGCGEQFGSRTPPGADAINVVSHLPKVTRHSLGDNLLGAFFLVQYRSIISQYRRFVCGKFYSLMLSCTAHTAPQTRQTAGVLAVSYPCAACGICPTQGGFGRLLRVNQN